jgi:hypothetical protein
MWIANLLYEVLWSARLYELHQTRTVFLLEQTEQLLTQF